MKNLQNSNLKRSNVYDSSIGDIDEKYIDEINEIITKVPPVILRWGISVFFAMFLTLLVTFSTVKLADTIPVRWHVAISGPPSTIVARQPGSLSGLQVKQNQMVSKGQLLSYFVPAGELQQSIALSAPSAGKISFNKILEAGTQFAKGELMFYIHTNAERHFLVISIPAAHIRAIKVGQQVMIDLSGYSPEKSEIAEGQITVISGEPDQNKIFSAKVVLKDAEREKKTNLQAWMKGAGRLVIKKITLIDRLTNGLIRL